MLPQKIFKIRMLRLAENEFHTTKFPDFPLVSEFPDIFIFSKSLDTLIYIFFSFSRPGNSFFHVSGLQGVWEPWDSSSICLETSFLVSY